MDDTVVFLFFCLLQSSYKRLNIFFRLVFNRCFMYGKVVGGRSIKVKIVGRAKSRGAGAIQELVSLDNFIFYFDSYVEDVSAEINKQEVSLYGFNTEFAFFSMVSSSVNSVWDGAFSSPEQFNKSEYLILVPLNELYKIVESSNSPANKKIIFLHHTNRCGSTLIAGMFKKIPSTRVICEPESFFSAYQLYHVKKVVTKEQYQEMVKAAVLTHCLTSHQTIFFKMVSGACTSQMNILNRLFPNSKTAFLSRNRNEVVSSMMRIVNTGHARSGRLLGWSRDTFIQATLWTREKETFPRDIEEVLQYNWNVCMEALKAAEMTVKAFTYEALVADPSRIVLELLKFFDIPDKYLEQMVKVMEKDSQEGTRISRTTLKLKTT